MSTLTGALRHSVQGGGIDSAGQDFFVHFLNKSNIIFNVIKVNVPDPNSNTFLYRSGSSFLDTYRAPLPMIYSDS